MDALLAVRHFMRRATEYGARTCADRASGQGRASSIQAAHIPDRLEFIALEIRIDAWPIFRLTGRVPGEYLVVEGLN